MKIQKRYDKAKNHYKQTYEQTKLAKNFFLSGLALWLVAILLAGGLNIILGTVLIDYAIVYITIIITFLFLDYE